MKIQTRRITLAASAVALVAAGGLVPAQAQAAQKYKFGSELDQDVQPSNSVPGLACDQADPGALCSFVMNEAYGRPDGGEKAPVRGKLKKVRVISGTAGAFQLQLTKAKQVNGVWRAKVKADGPVIQVQGQSDANWDSDIYKVETFRVNMPIRKGWRLTMKTTTTSAVRCSSGGDNTLLFHPSLQFGNPYQFASSDDGCWPLIEGVIKKRR